MRRIHFTLVFLRKTNPISIVANREIIKVVESCEIESELAEVFYMFNVMRILLFLFRSGTLRGHPKMLV